jgi:hypothetical protein
MNEHFHGTFAADDVNVLLTPHSLSRLTPEAMSALGGVRKEIGQELSHGAVFNAAFMRLYQEALDRNKERVALDAVRIARALAKEHGKEFAVLSLMRAGTVAGVLVQRALKLLGCQTQHYATNVVQGLRCNEALDYIRTRHADDKVVFLDGWTGKGSVAGQLKEFVSAYNASRAAHVSPRLVVLSDPGGVSNLAAGGDEYLLPHALLRVTASGLFSGAIVDADAQKLGAFDACIFYDNLHDDDVTTEHIAEITAMMPQHLDAPPASWTDADRARLRAVGLQFIEDSRRVYGQKTRVRPGLCEAARALVKCYPTMVLRLRDASDPDVAGLIALAESKGYEIAVDAGMPYRAAVMVQKE